MARKKILVVDDEMDMRTFVCSLLGTCGYKTIEATNGLEGIQKAKRSKPELIIMDAMMPKEGGIQMYRELKTDEDLKDIPVIMLSGLAKKTFFHSQKLLSAHIGQTVPEPEAYIEKPPESEEILQWAESLLGKQE